MSERPEPGTPEFQRAEAIAFNHFYKMHPELNLTANTFVLRQTAAELGLDLVTTTDITHVANYLGDALARIDNGDPVVQGPVEPPATYEERNAEYQDKLRNADQATLRKLALVDSLRKSGYTQQQISDALRDKGFSPLTQSEEVLLQRPVPTNDDLQAGRQSADNEVNSAAARIGQLAGLGRPITAQELKALPVQTFKRLIWPNGPGTRKSDENERLIDLVLGGGQ